jgi:hypothetical protein
MKWCNKTFPSFLPSDLQKYYYSWDGDDDGKVSYSDMRNQMGIHMPPEERMKHYDYNGDGSYSEYELSSAMGFDQYTTPPPVGKFIILNRCFFYP